jgi:spermidine synthase
MGGSHPEELPSPRVALLKPALAGLGLGVLSVAGGQGLVAAEAGVMASATVAAMLALALAAGMWAGAPGEHTGRPTHRWLAAGVMIGLAGALSTAAEINPSLGAGPVGLVLVVLFGIGLPAYALGMLGPALLEELDAADEEDPLRPVGTLAIAAALGFAAGVTLAGLLWGVLPPGPLLLGTGAALVVPALVGGEAPAHAEEAILLEEETAFGTVRIAEVAYPGERQPERRLYVDDEEESGQLVRSGAPTLAYIAAAEQWLAATTPRGASYLFLGGGAYTLPRRIAEHDPRARVTVVERDPQITRLAYRFFGLRPEHGVHSLHGDARAWLERLEERFDRIFVDVYEGREQLPYSMVTREALEAARRALNVGGVLSINAIGVVEGPGACRFWSVVRTLAETFPTVGVYAHLGRDFPGRQNVLLCASPEPQPSLPPRAGFFEAWPANEWPEVGARVLHDRFLQHETG